ncbi:MAG: hypothetical protein DI598_06500 [Pseudopedobacter saltans]|uniref:Uncharacterized protein n=1 Tax=Pseudopedobacter saltans TaxID=151895 RepID=A0A2W5F8E3_9SPHI|nr:MAG: hypothetical protein DI598_06500 [Pseudopedobacter saltans]
MFYFCCHACK